MNLEKTFNEAVEEDLLGTQEDAPQIVGILDERPLELRVADYRESDKWKPINITENTSFVAVKKEEDLSTDKYTKNNNLRKQKNCDDVLNIRVKIEDSSNENVEDTSQSRRDLNSSPRKRKTNSNPIKLSDEMSPLRKRSDLSPPRKRGGDLSPLRKKRNDLSPPRKRKDDLSPLRRRKGDLSPSRKKRSDLSPPRTRGVDLSPPRKRGGDLSPPRKKGGDLTPLRRKKDDLSPPRKRGSDLGPQRKRKGSCSPPRKRDDLNPPRKKGDDLSPPRRKSDLSPPRKKRSCDLSPLGRREGNLSLSGKTFDNTKIARQKNFSTNSTKNIEILESSDEFKNKDNREESPKRKRNGSTSPKTREKLEKEKSNKKERTRWNRSASPKDDKIPPSSKMIKTLDGKKAGLQDARDLVEETRAFKQREEELFKHLTAETSGVNATAIIRDKHTGKIRDFEKEAEEQLKKKKEENERKEKYSKWGKGLKQVEDQQQKFESDLHEMSKPLARYADDEDLERYLKEQEREGDPMLAYIRKKKKKKDIEEGKLGVLVIISFL